MLVHTVVSTFGLFRWVSLGATSGHFQPSRRGLLAAQCPVPSASVLHVYTKASKAGAAASCIAEETMAAGFPSIEGVDRLEDRLVS